ncbi:cell division protein FtsA [Paraphotobacterium marinum]|uniref:Cell division protein FtsA n=1 Tax=Paraphotobacterium marinum TaxID=1755811 RepID=A0A220VCB9_9GAMM|nr:cell division protein FtsA [Paraphotobacterium marinum]ASK77921.1 cell division protein FtsA [Paraphotobacterium marinum]
MTKLIDKQIIVGLDIGTSKISVVIGECINENEINIIGFGSSPSAGVDKGGVNDLESVILSVQNAINKAEEMSECEISNVYLSLSGRHIVCQTEKGMVPISDKEVTQKDVENVIHTARSVKINNEYKTLHVIPQEFTIDFQQGIKNPVGLSGVRMEATVHMINCHNDMAQNLVKAVQRCNLKVDDLIFSGLASSHSSLTMDEKELGVCLIDIGAGTMDLAIWTGGSLRYAAVIPYAGNNVTADIAYAFGTPTNNAEELKVKFGCALSSEVNKDDKIDVPSVGGRPSRTLHSKTLAEVIEPRYIELFGMIREKIDEIQINLNSSGTKHHLAAGVVLTGGASKIEGIADCAERIFQMQARVGVPVGVYGLNEKIEAPDYATAVGLLKYARDNRHYLKKNIAEPKKTYSILTKVTNWFRKEF